MTKMLERQKSMDQVEQVTIASIAKARVFLDLVISSAQKIHVSKGL